MSTPIPLKDLTLRQVCYALLPNTNFSILKAIIEENEIDGLALDSVKKFEDLVKVFSTIAVFKIRAFFIKITEWKKTGVHPDLLLLQEDKPSTQLPYFAAESVACIQYEKLVKSPIYLKCLPFLDKNITFEESMAPIRNKLAFRPMGELSIGELEIVATNAIRHGNTCDKDGINISSDEIAALGAYTAESELYKILNTELRSNERSNLTPFIQFIILLTRAIAKCPIPVADVVYRAFKNDVSKDYTTDKKITWAQLSSSTTNIKEAENFLSENNEGVMQGTLFIIELSEKDSARNIQAFSTITKEAEVIFAPMSSFQVSGVMDTKSGLIIVHLRTIPSTRCLLQYVLLPSSDSSALLDPFALSASPSIFALVDPFASASLSPSFASVKASALLDPFASSSPSFASASSSSSASKCSNTLLPKAVLKDWGCPACTFINKGSLGICGLCGAACDKTAAEVPQNALQMQVGPKASTEKNKNFTFQSAFDENGVLFHIGTNGGTQLYHNPHESGRVVASRSSDGSILNGGDVKFLVGHTSEINFTADEVGSWMAVDLGEDRQLVVTNFCLRYGWSCTSAIFHFPKNFELQGSGDGVNWIAIQRYESDNAIWQTNKGYASNVAPLSKFGDNYPWAHWVVDPTNDAFRHFRILQFGPHQGGGNILALSGLELYGELTE